MRFLFLLSLIFLSVPLAAQNLNGVVKDARTQLPIANAQIIGTNRTVLTNNKGAFSLNNIKAGDQLAIRIMGYETIELKVNLANLSDTMRIYLYQTAINLKEVVVKQSRNYQLDSFNLRKEYASVFAYKGPSFKDMFITVDPNYRSPFANTTPNSTASLVKINVLQVFSLLGKKKNQTNKLKQTLLADEETNYIDHSFSKEKVMALTKLQGDSLRNFMNHYRPSIMALKKMTDYELSLYIKKSYLAYINDKP